MRLSRGPGDPRQHCLRRWLLELPGRHQRQLSFVSGKEIVTAGHGNARELKQIALLLLNALQTRGTVVDRA
jgi:hypothetical protein